MPIYPKKCRQPFIAPRTSPGIPLINNTSIDTFSRTVAKIKKEQLMYAPGVSGLLSVVNMNAAQHLIKKAIGIIILLGVLSARWPIIGRSTPVRIMEIIVICR